MERTQDPAYGMTARFRLPLAAARAKITDALKAEGFGVLTEIDVQATMKAKLGVDFRPYVILGACNPSLAHRALSSELAIGLLLPCNVCLWQEGDDTVVSIARPHAMFQVVDNPGLKPLADEATAKLESALARMKG